MELTSKKEGKYLIFEFDDGKNVRFDLSDGQFVGKKGMPVKSLTGQLAGYSIAQVIESFGDEKYKKFLQCVYDKTAQTKSYWSPKKYSNVGTFLNYVREWLNLEQFFASGFINIDLNSKSLKLSDVPKGLQKLCREKNYKLTESLLYTYKHNPNMWDLLLRVDDFEIYSPYKTITNKEYGLTQLDKFITLVSTYNYKPQSLARYVDNILRFEGEDYQKEVIEQLYDYVTMMSAISNKFEKYPRYLRTTHNIAVRNYNRLKKEFSEEMFKSRIDVDMEFDYKNWTIIYPKSTQEIKDEAVQQNNCVASYIDRVIGGECHILFLRCKDNKNKSIVTIEVRDKRVVQQKGKFNRDTNENEKLVLTKYEEYLNKNNKKECA